jgi:predicted O-methyltransferase YrrM
MRPSSSDTATIRGDSDDPDTLNELRRVLDGRFIDLLFLDADLTYDGVRADFEMYDPLVRSGGIVAYHDILPRPAYREFEVHKYWQEIAQTRELKSSSICPTGDRAMGRHRRPGHPVAATSMVARKLDAADAP